MPQWVFLSTLFNDVLVKDRVALATSGSSSRVNLLRRVGLGSVVLAAILCLTGFAVSFLRNRALETRVHDAVADLTHFANREQSGGECCRPAKTRQFAQRELVDISDYEVNGAPFSLRWGLYVGDQIYPDAKRVYFQRFRQLLFAETQKRLTDNLEAVSGKSAANAPNDAYEKTYNDLKAYLITTEPADHDKSTKEFLTPVLMSHWVADRDIDKDRKDLAAIAVRFLRHGTREGKSVRDGQFQVHDRAGARLSEAVCWSRSLLRAALVQSFAARPQF